MVGSSEPNGFIGRETAQPEAKRRRGPALG
jgi:hypothetical protein